MSDGFNEFELAGAGENKSPHPAVGIHDTLKVGEELGRTLNLIKDGSLCDLAEKGAGILGGKGAGVWILQRVVGEIRSEEPGKSGFSRLPRACNGENRKTLEALKGSLNDKTWNWFVGTQRRGGFRHND